MSPEPKTIAARLEVLNEVLLAHREVWAPMPFKTRLLAWEKNYPDLADALRQLPEADLVDLEVNPARARRYLSRWLPRAADIAVRCEPDAFEDPIAAPEKVSPEGIRERKWAQIQAFAGAAPDVPVAEILEWCSGKGHLGRILAATRKVPVVCIEIDQRLADHGRHIAAEELLSVQFSVNDALAADAATKLKPDQLAVALHACGDLHCRLIDLVATSRPRAVAIAPCCYHLTADPIYHPLSRVAREGGLRLTREDLRLCLQETVVASPAAQRRRDTQAQWRLGFDLLQRNIRGQDTYLPVPPVPSTVYREGFDAFLAWAAKNKGLVLPADIGTAELLERGRVRFEETRRLTVPRHLFRRILEMWLILDRAQALVEAGYRVEVGLFCARELTPRNVMIRGYLE